MDLNDVYLSLSNGHKQAHNLGDAGGEFVQKVLDGIDCPFYQVEAGGVIYVYAVLFDFRTQAVVRYESRLVLNRRDAIADL
jgi:hypothetical protein